MDRNELVLLIQAQAESAKASLKGLKQEFSNLKTETSNLTNSFKSLGKSLINLYLIKKSVGYLMSTFKSSVDYTETLNLFTVALGENVQKGIKFQNQMNEAFGTNKEELMRSQGLYTALSTSLGLASDQAYTLGENMTKLSLDLSSLYNKDIETVNQALKSGLVGQTKAVRQLGMDITEKTLNAQLLSMGITDKTTAVMSQTEKVVLRYIVMLKQAGLSQADFAKTIESPANQLRILKQQVAEISRWIGNIFYGALKNTLPYINAFAMVIKEVIKSIAIVFGYTEQGFGGATTSVEELGTGLGDANTNAKKLKNTLQSFDEIHNIETDTGGDGTASVGGIDSRLLEAMSSYDNKMAGVAMKATLIRDRIMEWLGFTKTVDEKTGEVSFKLKDGYQNLEKIGDALKIIAKVFIGIKIFSIIDGILKAIKTSALLPILGKIASGIGALFTAIAGALGLPVVAVVAIVVALATLGVVIYKFRKQIGEWFSDLGKSIKNSFEDAINWVKEIWGNLSGWFNENVTKPIMNFLTPIINNIVLVVTKIWEVFKTIGQVIWELLKWVSGLFYEYILKPIIDVFNKVINFIAPFVKSFIDELAKIETFIYERVILPVYNFFKGLFDSIVNLFKTIGQAIGDAIKSALRASLNVIFDVVEFLLNGVIKVINNLSGLTNKITGSKISSIKEVKLQRFANGGFPTTGQMFLANENGPEMVGSIGNKTAVANNDQIVSAVSQGVAQAVAGVLSGKGGTNQFQLFIDGKEITNLVVKDINGMTQQFGTSPLK